jgi:hypothetical protein
MAGRNLLRDAGSICRPGTYAIEHTTSWQRWQARAGAAIAAQLLLIIVLGCR